MTVKEVCLKEIGVFGSLGQQKNNKSHLRKNMAGSLFNILMNNNMGSWIVY